MRQDEIIEMARQAGFIDADWNIRIVLPHLERFAKLVAQHEREACARVCEIKAEVMAITGKSCDPDDLAKAIRAREQE